MDATDRPKKRPRATTNEEPSKGLTLIPTLSGGVSSVNDSDEFQRIWDTYQVVYLPRSAVAPATKDPSFSWKDIHAVFQGISDADKSSFCVETSSKSQGADREPVPTVESCFRVAPPNEVGTPYYCSFLVQKDEPALESLVSKLPVSRLHSAWHHEPCVWIFYGGNLDKSPDNLQGRPEHTDSISHDGTWHYQLSGIKHWLLRPTAKLLDHWNENQPEIRDIWQKNGQDYRVTVACQEGDVLVVNTRLWFHQTILPSQAVPSVSYARDFWSRPKPDGDNDDDEGNMTNVDGLYATEDIEAGTILFHEHDMPDCELHRSKENPNCELVELEDGSGAVVSCRSIAAGEFFCIAESDDDEDYSTCSAEDASLNEQCKRCPE
jgi:U3 small nucleolar RNA-associated protein 6